jgi:GH25 family lysozyme M1 (1,4-beta-N-acetylmuramidase)
MMCAAFAAVTVAASCVLVSGGPTAPETRLSAVTVADSLPTPSVRHAINPASPPAATPAEGHSPQLEKELSGPLSGTGQAAPTRSPNTSAAAMQATATAALTSPTLNGIDVASFQHPNGAAIDWAQVAGAGYSFAAIKATEGNYYINPYYAGDAAAATAAGLYVSAYEFANPADSTGTAAADYTVQNAGNYKVGGRHLPLMLDLEYNPYTTVAGGNECYGLTPSAMVSWISSFVTEATTITGAAPIIYTPTDWWNLCTGSSGAFGSDLLWIPAYSVSTPGPLPAGWSTWTFWQYTSSGSVPGITGAVDLDYMSATVPAITSANQVTFGTGVASSFTVRATGFPAPAFSESGALPTGVTFNDGVLSGTPPSGTEGSYPFQITATNGAGSVTQSFTLTVLSADWNVALGQPAGAKSVYSRSYPATNAVDGSISTIFASYVGGGNQWWEVPLARQYTLSEAQVVFRSDGYNYPTERENFQIWVSNSADMSISKTVACTVGATPVSYAGTYTCSLPSGPWQYVAVVKSDLNELVFAEVRIFGH